jgi:hypothetical protein
MKPRVRINPATIPEILRLGAELKKAEKDYAAFLADWPGAKPSPTALKILDSLHKANTTGAPLFKRLRILSKLPPEKLKELATLPPEQVREFWQRATHSKLASARPSSERTGK